METTIEQQVALNEALVPSAQRPTVAATLRLTSAAKDKQTAKASKDKSLSALSEVARTEAQQLKIVIKRSRQQTYISQHGGSGTDEGTGSKPGFPDVSTTDESKEELSWNSSDDEGADDKAKDGNGDEDDEGDDVEEGKEDDDDEEQEVTKIDDKDDTEESGDDDEEGSCDEEDDNEETRDGESFDLIPQTLQSNKDESDGEEDHGLNIGEEERLNEEEEADELYRDVDINQGRGLQVNQEVEDSYVILTLVHPDGQQESSSMSTMAMTLDQQVALDEALVPSTQRLRIGRSNLRLPSDIQSKEPTLQVVYDVLRNSPFFRAFLVTADVPEIYMQEFWATAKLHQHSIYFKMDTRKHVLNLEAFREMLYISPRIPGQSFDEFPFEEEILEFLRFLRHSTQIKTLTDVNVNKLYQPWRSFAAVINKCLTGKSSGIGSLRISQAQILWGLYHGSNAAPKLKASARKKTSGSASSTTPPTPIVTQTPTTTVVAAPRLYVAAKGKQPQRGSGTDEGTGSRPGVPDVPSNDSEEEISWDSFDDEDVDEQTKGREESEGDKTEESNDDADDQDEADKEEEDAEELYRDVNINQGRGLQVSQETEDTHVILTPTQSDAQQESLSTSSFITNLLNPVTDPVLESLFTTGQLP
nr:hypothetical protein [Tanacetum cinerariifolium]